MRKFSQAILKINALMFVVVACGKGDFKGAAGTGLFDTSSKPVKNGTGSENPVGNGSDSGQSGVEKQGNLEDGKNGCKSQGHCNDSRTNSLLTKEDEEKKFQKALDECLAAWSNHPFTEENIRDAKKNAVKISFKNANNQNVYSDESKSDQIKLKLVSISADHNLNGSNVRLLDPNGYYCLLVQAGNNANKFTAQYKCGQNTRVHSVKNIDLNSHDFALECVQ